MAAVTESDRALPADAALPTDAARPVDGPGCSPDPFPVPDRVVAVAVTADELLRAGSDLARAVAGGPVDLLLACDGSPSGGGAVDLDELDEIDDDLADLELRAGVHRLGLAGLAWHRLALPGPLTGAAEDDLVAALSELVGFDPEPGVHVLAPAPAGDPQGAVVDRATRRIAAVYGLPLRHYRCGYGTEQPAG